jgi:tetratricopeptide (TPR) repeat protein
VALHTDTGLALWEEGGTSEALAHWHVCQDLMRLLPTGTNRANFVRAWHLAIGGYLGETAFWNAERILDEGLRLSPSDAQLETAAGALHEQLATPEAQRDIKLWKELQKSVVWARGRFELKDRKGELRMAAEHLRRAITARPDLGEAQLRWGHVLMELGDRQGAQAALKRAASDIDPFVAYNAMLLLGRLYQDAGQLGQARASYEGALGLARSSQSALVALSLLYLDSGDRASASSALAQLTAEGRFETADMWWQYGLGAGRTASSNFAAVWQTADAAKFGSHE